MKNNYLSISIAIALALGLLFTVSFNKKSERKYEPRQENKESLRATPGAEYIARLRLNPETHTIETNDIVKAQKQLADKLEKNKRGESNWIFKGPDNIGGRTRSILIDKDNSSIMYAGGVAGGLWKTTSSGQYWQPVEYGGANIEDFANLAISTICQASNGDIYFGTGESYLGLHGGNTHTPMIMGAGIWKSTDNGQTFNRIESTWNSNDAYETFSLVNKLASDPNNPNLIYAATANGLKYSDDGGSTWQNPIFEGASNTISSDVEINSNGDVIASVSNKCLLKKAGDDKFRNKSGSSENNQIDMYNIGRLDFSYAPQDPNYVYCIAAASNGTLQNIYKSADGGDNWVVIGNGGGAVFQPLGHQGTYDLCIAVNPNNKDEVYIGGLDLWKGYKPATGEIFQWSQISIWSMPPTTSLYVHADQHTIVFDLKNPKTFFIGSDGGVSRCRLDYNGIQYQFSTMNNNYNVTQFYASSANGSGAILGGTQDNGTILMKPESSEDYTGHEAIGGDGGQTALSNINPSIAFGTLYFGGLFRNNDKDFKDWNTFYSPDFKNYHWEGGEFNSSANQASFVTPIAYWENPNDPYDTIAFVAKKKYPKDTVINMVSHNIFKAPITVTLDKDYDKGDTIFYKDKYSTLFAIGMKRQLWLTRSAANFNKTLYNEDWWKALDAGVLSDDEYITQVIISKDGNYIFFSTSENDLYRLSNLNEARRSIHAHYDPFHQDWDVLQELIVTKLTKIGNTGNRTITGLASDPNNSNNLIVTLGNYGYNNYVYLVTSAKTIETSNGISNYFIDITGDLPKVPVFCGLFEMDESKNTVMLGTDMGVFMSEGLFSQVSSSNVEWVPDQTNVGPVPVFQIKQNTAPYEFSNEYFGSIHIATHGRGIFENKSYVSCENKPKDNDFAKISKIDFNVYPNPLVSNATLEVNIPNDGDLSIYIYSINGQLVETINKGFQFEGNVKVDFSADRLTSGTYIVTINLDGKQSSKRIVKR